MELDNQKDELKPEEILEETEEIVKENIEDLPVEEVQTEVESSPKKLKGKTLFFGVAIAIFIIVLPLLYFLAGIIIAKI